MVSYEMYSYPWYYLPPKYRKTVFIHMSLLQKPIKIQAFGIFPVSLKMFPDILNFVKTYIQIYLDLRKK